MCLFIDKSASYLLRSIGYATFLKLFRLSPVYHSTGMNNSSGINTNTNNDLLSTSHATGSGDAITGKCNHQPTIYFFHSLTVYLESCLDEGVFTFANSSAEVLSDQVSSNVFPFPMVFIVLPFTFNAQKHTRMTIL